MRHVRHARDAVAKRKPRAGSPHEELERRECEGIGHCHLTNPPASPEDSFSSTVSGMVQCAIGWFAPFPLTLGLSLREREQPAAIWCCALDCWSSSSRCMIERRRTVLPLPRGEGRGEGEPRVALLTGKSVRYAAAQIQIAAFAQVG